MAEKTEKVTKTEKAQEKAPTREELEKSFKEYSVAEFFKKNRQMLGYSGKIRSLTTLVHEFVTNSLDSCEDAKILPEIRVEIAQLPDDHYKLVVEDNGTGIPKKNVGQALGKLLAGSKFSQRAQRRGQQGIGAAYATLFAQITTGKPTKVKTGLGDGKVYECLVSVDIKSNEPAITDEKEYAGKFKGLRVEAEYAEVGYNRSEYGSYEYLRRTALANPHCQITLVEPDNQITVFPRASKDIPKKPKNVQPHPLGITTSDLMDMAQVTTGRKISSFLVSDFTRVSAEKVKELQALMPAVDLERSPKALAWAEAEELVKNFQKVKWIAPETDALIPIGEDQLEKSLKNLLEPEKLKVVERKPRVFRGGIPFSVEVAIAYGGKSGQQVGEARKGELTRFANRVPLLFDAGNCAITEAFKSLDLNRYDLKEFETMPVTILVNFVSVYVPYTGAGKLAISAEEEIVAEIRFALMEAARDISTYLHGLAKAEEQERRRLIFFKYIKEIAQALEDVTGRKASVLEPKLKKIAEERTALLEAQEEGDPEAEKALEEIEDQFEEEVKNEG
ncbi:DNA topoisomerase VI subunit B [Candidatus Micrarchaeota archaeon]|nr:DNA topoisomerase VI subunit B [Candidatus Micrarchaeota archaeon]